ncbi:MAG: hypothetical protein KIT62_04815 [Cyclobacteriaceae bacterium]|nr:hypothetical protein [Cyclobacteriaceae bacterium]
MTPLFKKLNLKDQPVIHIIQAPQSFQAEMDAIRKTVAVSDSLSGSEPIEFFLAFVTKQNEVSSLSKKAGSRLADDGLLWLAYPKGSSKKYTCEFNRDSGWDELGKLGFEPVRQVAIDEDWSALRFRRVAFIKKMTRSFALTNEGRKKVKAAKKEVQKTKSKKQQ